MIYRKTRLTDNQITFIFPEITTEIYTLIEAVKIIAYEIKRILKYKSEKLRPELDQKFLLKKFNYCKQTKKLEIIYEYYSFIKKEQEIP